MAVCKAIVIDEHACSIPAEQLSSHSKIAKCFPKNPVLAYEISTLPQSRASVFSLWKEWVLASTMLHEADLQENFASSRKVDHLGKQALYHS